MKHTLYQTERNSLFQTLSVHQCFPNVNKTEQSTISIRIIKNKKKNSILSLEMSKPCVLSKYNPPQIKYDLIYDHFIFKFEINRKSGWFFLPTGKNKPDELVFFRMD